MIKCEIFRELPEDAAAIRREVFMEEQGFSDEFDEIDGKASHVVAYEDGAAIAVARFFWDAERGGYVIGRLAVRKEFRGRAVGSAVLRAVEAGIAQVGGHTSLLAAQIQAKSFYEAQGYTAYGSAFMDEHCPHIWMRKDLDQHAE